MIHADVMGEAQKDSFISSSGEMNVAMDSFPVHIVPLFRAAKEDERRILKYSPTSSGYPLALMNNKGNMICSLRSEF